MVLLTTEGLHVPEILFVEVVGSEGTPCPEQILNEVPKLKTGVVLGVTVTLMVTGIPHWFGSGVNV